MPPSFSIGRWLSAFFLCGAVLASAHAAAINCVVTFSVGTDGLIIAAPTEAQITCADAALRQQFITATNSLLAAAKGRTVADVSSDVSDLAPALGSYRFVGVGAMSNRLIVRFEGSAPTFAVQVDVWQTDAERGRYVFTWEQAAADPEVARWLRWFDPTSALAPPSSAITMVVVPQSGGDAPERAGLPPPALRPAVALAATAAAMLNATLPRGPDDDGAFQAALRTRFESVVGAGQFDALDAIVAAWSGSAYSVRIVWSGRNDGYRVDITSLALGDTTTALDALVSKFDAPTAAASATTPATGATLAANRARLLEKIRAHETAIAEALARQRPLTPPVFLTQQERDALTAIARAQPRVAEVATDASAAPALPGAVLPANARNPLKYQITYAPSSVRLDSTLAYNPERGLTGDLTGTGSNLFVVGDVASLSTTGGDGTRDASASYSRPWGSWRLEGTKRNTAAVGATYAYDHDVLFGQTSAAHAAEEGGGVYLRNETQLRTDARRSLKLRVTVGAEKFSLRSVAPLFARPPGGQDGYAAVGLVGALSPARATSASPLSAHLEANGLFEVKQAWHSGGDSFQTGYFAASAEVFSGTPDARETFFRIDAGAGRASHRTPAHALFRLGGDNMMRALEEGELTGRNYTFARLEAGVALAYLLGGMGRKKTPGAGAVPGLPPISVFGFVEACRVDGTEDFVDTATRRTAAQSFGLGLQTPVAAKTGTMSVQLGYAWSRQAMHKAGRPFTAIGVSFLY